MLVAALSGGGVLSLVSANIPRHVLVALTKRQTFFCPVCGSPVILKMGTKKRWHFSHHPLHPCREYTEPETETHLIGKKDLFHWTGKNSRSPLLEHYLPLIHQRPDIYLPGIQPVALEYQCSAISDQLLCKRTLGYLSQHIDPIWIIGGKRYKGSGPLVKLSGFEPLTIRCASPIQPSQNPFYSPYYVCYYHPDRKKFSFSMHLQPITEHRFIAQKITIDLSDATPTQLMTPRDAFNPHLFKKRWLESKRKYRLKPPIRCSVLEKQMRERMYLARVAFSYFPSYVGLPHQDYMHLSAPPLLWQMWLYLVFSTYLPRTWLTAGNLIDYSVKTGVKALFSRRVLKLCPNRTLEQIINVYLSQLSCLHVAMKKGDAYQIHANAIQGRMTMERLLIEDNRILNRLEQEWHQDCEK